MVDNEEQALKFSPTSKFGADCFRDTEGLIWRGKVVPGGVATRDETLRLHMLHEAADAYGKAVRKAIDPFPADA